MNPYRTIGRLSELGTRGARFLRRATLARFAVLFLGASTFALGWSCGRPAKEMPQPASTVPEIAVTADPAEPESPEPATQETLRGYVVSPKQAKATIAQRAREVLAAITRRDAHALSRFLDPETGLRIFTTSPTLPHGMEADADLTVAEVARCFEDRQQRGWRPEDGHLNTATCADLWTTTLGSADFAHAPHVDYNLFSPTAAPAALLSAYLPGEDGTLERYPYGIVVQYAIRKPELDDNWPAGRPSLRAWSTLRLVFEPHDEQWTLRAIEWMQWQD